jgi:hypothetical protein
MTFPSQAEAKQFLANKIITEAGFQSVPLSEVDKRLLFYSVDEPESAAGIPEDELADVNDDYEDKIGALLKQAFQRDQDKPEEQQKYRDAIQELKKGDHYLLVMAQTAIPDSKAIFPAGKRTKDILYAVIAGILVLIAAFLYVLWKS